MAFTLEGSKYSIIAIALFKTFQNKTGLTEANHNAPMSPTVGPQPLKKWTKNGPKRVISKSVKMDLRSIKN